MLTVQEVRGVSLYRKLTRALWLVVINSSILASRYLFQSYESVVLVLGESWLWLGQNPNDVSPREAVSKRNGAALMIIQNHGDQITPEDDGRAIAAAAGPSTELWIVSSNGHGDAIFEKPDEYASRVTRFLAHAFDAGLTGG